MVVFEQLIGRHYYHYGMLHFVSQMHHCLPRVRVRLNSILKLAQKVLPIFMLPKNNVDRYSDSVGFEDVVEKVAASQIHDIIIGTFITCRFYWVTL